MRHVPPGTPCWFVKDFADGWIKFYDVDAAINEAKETGAVMRYSADGSNSLVAKANAPIQNHKGYQPKGSGENPGKPPNQGSGAIFPLIDCREPAPIPGLEEAIEQVRNEHATNMCTVDGCSKLADIYAYAQNSPMTLPDNCTVSYEAHVRVDRSFLYTGRGDTPEAALAEAMKTAGPVSEKIAKIAQPGNPKGGQ